jgi:peptide/nickel transport system permease protein
MSSISVWIIAHPGQKVDAISNRDYALVQGCLLAIGLPYVLVNLLTARVYRWVNPRMRA